MMSVQMQPAETDMGFFSKSNVSATPSRTTVLTRVRRIPAQPAKTETKEEAVPAPPPPSSSPLPAPTPSRYSSISRSTPSPFSSPLSSPASSPTPTVRTDTGIQKKPRLKRKSSEPGPSTGPAPKVRATKKLRVEKDKPRKRASNGNSRASPSHSRTRNNQANASPIERIYRSRSSRSRSASMFPSAAPSSFSATPQIRDWACAENGKTGPAHISSERVVRNLQKSYKAYFKNSNDPDDKSFEPENLPTADLEYPNSYGIETFSLLAPKDKDHYNPIMDLEQSLYTIVTHYLTPQQQSLIGLPPSEILSEALSPPLSPSPSPPNSQASSHSSHGSLSSLTTLETSSPDQSPPHSRVNYCRAVQRAINTRDGPLLLKSMHEINKLLHSFKYPSFSSLDPFAPLPQNSLKHKVTTWTHSGGLPPKVLMRIIDENYQRCVGPNIAKLRKYEAFSSQVYGELLPSLVSDIITSTKLTQDSLFMDLGSGVGNIVVQAALQTGCRSFGVEISEGPAGVAREMVEQFKGRCRMWGVRCGEIELEEGDMLESERVRELLPQADVVLVDNKVFEESLNEALRPKFLDLKEGAVVISLKPFVSSLNGLNARVTERNVDDISAIFDVTERPYYPGAVSWGNGGGSYYIHRVDREGYAVIRQQFERSTRGRRSGTLAKYQPSRNTDESDWFGQ